MSPLSETLQFSPVELKKPEQRIDLDSTQVGELEAFVHSLRRPVRRKPAKSDQLDVLAGETLFKEAGLRGASPGASCQNHRGVQRSLAARHGLEVVSYPRQPCRPFRPTADGRSAAATAAGRSDWQVCRRFRSYRANGGRRRCGACGIGGRCTCTTGPAATLEEAIAWHGGESEESVEKFNDLLVTDRASLVAFLNTRSTRCEE